MMKRALWQGLVAGAAGVVAMTLAEKLEQRLTSDQILENATGVGAPPSTWPRRELAIDVLHKTTYGLATGAVADALAARHGPGPGQQQAAVIPGRRSNIGPIPCEHAFGWKR